MYPAQMTAFRINSARGVFRLIPLFLMPISPQNPHHLSFKGNYFPFDSTICDGIHSSSSPEDSSILYLVSYLPHLLLFLNSWGRVLIIKHGLWFLTERVSQFLCGIGHSNYFRIADQPSTIHINSLLLSLLHPIIHICLEWQSLQAATALLDDPQRVWWNYPGLFISSVPTFQYCFANETTTMLFTNTALCFTCALVIQTLGSFCQWATQSQSVWPSFPYPRLEFPIGFH